MAKRLIIATNSATIDAEVRNAITRYLEGRGWSVWHWFEDLWLVVGVDEKVNVQALREELRAAIVKQSCQFLIIDPGEQVNQSGYISGKAVQWIQDEWIPLRP